MAEEKKAKVLKLTLNNNFIEKIVAQLEEMKTNHNKIVKITGGSDVVLVINHMDNDLNKKTEKKKE